MEQVNAQISVNVEAECPRCGHISNYTKVILERRKLDPDELRYICYAGKQKVIHAECPKCLRIFTLNIVGEDYYLL